MPKIVSTYEKDGETINVYESGAHYNVTRRQLVKAPPHAAITKETSREMLKKRQEKAARLLRERIRESTAKISDLPINSSAAAVAEAGGILWEEIVLNAEAYPRDRLEAWSKLGQVAGVLSNESKREASEKSDPAATVGALAELVRELRQSIQAQPAERPANNVIDGTATDIRNE